jgi:hypothetical protein
MKGGLNGLNNDNTLLITGANTKYTKSTIFKDQTSNFVESTKNLILFLRHECTQNGLNINHRLLI